MNFFRRIFSSRILPSWTILLFDACIVAGSVLFAYLIRYPASTIVDFGRSVWISVTIVTFANLVFFKILHAVRTPEAEAHRGRKVPVLNLQEEVLTGPVALGGPSGLDGQFAGKAAFHFEA